MKVNKHFTDHWRLWTEHMSNLEPLLSEVCFPDRLRISMPFQVFQISVNDDQVTSSRFAAAAGGALWEV